MNNRKTIVMSLKNLLLIIIATVSVSCGNGKQNAKVNKESITKPVPIPGKETKRISANQELKAEFDKVVEAAMGDNPTADELHNALSILYGWYGDEIDDPEEKVVQIMQKLDKLNGYNFGNSPYSSIAKIDNELHRLYNEIENSEQYHDGYALKTFTTRLAFHLSNPLTFNNNLPKTNTRVKILRTPDKKYRFYSFNKGETGTTAWYSTYVQYVNGRGDLVSQQWDEESDDGKNSIGLLAKIWQFKHKNIDYYVAQKYMRASMEQQYLIEIFTISNGKPIYYTEFYPEGISQEVCQTMNREHEIDYNFNPETLTVSYTTYEDDYESEGKKINGSWKFNLK